MKDLDRQICAILQENARLSLSEIAEQIGSSVPTVSEHVKKLEADGIIREYTTVLDAVSFEFDVLAFIFVDLDSSVHYDNFRRQCRTRREILECHAVTGTASHLLKVRVRSTAMLEQLLSAVQQWKGVGKTFTNVVLSTHKETLSIPLTIDR
ncbi:MAG: Lrp/AsnC family transcriptional regulator [Candidatus Kapabacteria bacterium]|nr:Lrp/AsnC family transcriptional regulator [Candidatus Kapabacteria bacterium]